MLHTKFHDNRSTGSGEEDFKEFSPYMAWRPYCFVTKLIKNNLIFFLILKIYI